jgi:hypothetical protein
MDQQFLHSDWGLLLVPVPFLCTLLAGFMRLDVAAASPRNRHAKAPATGRDRSGRVFYTDPDGRCWYPAKHLK